jgi:hypothetical protein
MKNFKTLEVGKTYKNKLNQLVKIVDYFGEDTYPFGGDDNNTYTLDGSKYSNLATIEDLIELIEDKHLTIEEIDAEIKRLQELRKELDKSVEVSNEWLDNEIRVRSDGKYKNIGFWLNPTYNWELVADEHKCLVLVPTKK